ncbi:hypothetical protein Tco_1226138 [Tanacetum coccineum]
MLSSCDSMEVLCLFSDMQKDLRIRPNEVSFVALVNACGDLDAFSQGVWVNACNICVWWMWLMEVNGGIGSNLWTDEELVRCGWGWDGSGLIQRLWLVMLEKSGVFCRWWCVLPNRLGGWAIYNKRPELTTHYITIKTSKWGWWWFDGDCGGLPMALSATIGLRAIRYVREVEVLGRAVALGNDKGWSWYHRAIKRHYWRDAWNLNDRFKRIGPKNVNNAAALRYAMEQLCDEVPIMIIPWIRFQRVQILQNNISYESQHDKVGTNVTLMSNAQPNSRHDPGRRAHEISQNLHVLPALLTNLIGKKLLFLLTFKKSGRAEVIELKNT